MSIADNLATGIEKVTRKHYKIKRAEERMSRDPYPRRSYSYRSWRPQPTKTRSIKDVAFEVMPAAIAKVSSGGRYVFQHRQLFYAVRPLVLARLPNKELKSAYFYTIAIEYEEEYGPIPGHIFDARGNFHSPHRSDVVPLGTLAVHGYAVPDDEYQGVLYIEKEGFWELLRETSLLQRYDLALVMGKGYATRAAKELLAKAEDQGIPILVAHDCDIAGYEIARTLQEATRTWADELDVIDIGLTVADVQEMALETEPAHSRKSAPWTFRSRLNVDETTFFRQHDLRCELNAMTSEQFIAWLERKLAEQGLDKKLVPEEETLRAKFQEYGQKHLTTTEGEVVKAVLAGLGISLDDLHHQAYDLLTADYAAPEKLHEKATEDLNSDDHRALWWQTYIERSAEKHADDWAKEKKPDIVRRLVKELRTTGDASGQGRQE